MHLSEQVSLFHDPDKLFFTNLSISISVSFVNHFLELFICHGFAQFSSNSFQILEGKFSCVIIVKKPESFKNFLSWVSFADLSCHEFHEICKLNHSFAISINLSDEFLDFLFFGLKAEGSHGDFEFLGIDVTWIK